jgi:hypothetical protein
MTQNKVSSGDAAIVGGVYQEKQWEDKLSFKRVSWFYGAVMYYDAYLTYLAEDSPFFAWIGEGSKQELTNCQKILIAMVYSSSSKKIGHATFIEQMNRQGLYEVNLLNFSQNMRVHPDFRAWNLNHYKVKGFCENKNSVQAGQNLSFNFPGFKAVRVQL